MLEDVLSYEDIIVLKSILLERSTFFTSKMLESITNILKCSNEVDVDIFIDEYNYYQLKKNVVNKVYEFLKEI